MPNEFSNTPYKMAADKEPKEKTSEVCTLRKELKEARKIITERIV